MSSIETWRPVVGYEDLYEVSDQGRVRSLDRVFVRTNGVPQSVKGRVLKPGTDKDGYRTVALSRGGKATTRRIHRLVLSAFVGPCPTGQEVRHLNGVPGDNRLSNLAYGTSSENRRDRWEHGTDHNLNKTHCNNGHDHFEENNIPSQAKRGKRSCLICSRADSYIRNNNIPEADHWKVRDYYLERFLLEGKV